MKWWWEKGELKKKDLQETLRLKFDVKDPKSVENEFLGFAKGKLYGMPKDIKKRITLTDGTTIFIRSDEWNPKIFIEKPFEEGLKKKKKGKEKKTLIREKICPAYVIYEDWLSEIKGILVSNDFGPPYLWIPFRNGNGEKNFEYLSFGDALDENGREINAAETSEIYNLDYRTLNLGWGVLGHLKERKVEVEVENIIRNNLEASWDDEPVETYIDRIDLIGDYYISPFTWYDILTYTYVDGVRTQNGTETVYILYDNEQEGRGEIISQSTDVLGARMQRYEERSWRDAFLEKIVFGGTVVETSLYDFRMTHAGYAKHTGATAGYGWQMIDMWGTTQPYSWAGFFGDNWIYDSFHLGWWAVANESTPGVRKDDPPEYPTAPYPTATVYGYGGEDGKAPIYEQWSLPNTTYVRGGASYLDVSEYIYLREISIGTEYYWEDNWFVNNKYHYTIKTSRGNDHEIYYGVSNAIYIPTINSYNVGRREIKPYFLYGVWLNNLEKKYGETYYPRTNQHPPWYDKDGTRILYGLIYPGRSSKTEEQMVEKTVQVNTYQEGGFPVPQHFIENSGVKEISQGIWWACGECVAVRVKITEEGTQELPWEENVYE